MLPCLTPSDKKLMLRVASNAQKAAEKIIDNAQSERDAGNVAPWVAESLRQGRADLKFATRVKDRLESVFECT